MKYHCAFPNDSIEKKFYKVLSKISEVKMQETILKAIETLEENPRPFGSKSFKQISPSLEIHQMPAQYRIKIGNYRLLYDVDDTKKVVWLLALRKRDKKTYKMLIL